MNNDYLDFLARKAQLGGEFGFASIWMPDFLFDFQRHLVDWAIRKGRAAIFADCGLGKTPMQLVWAENVIRKENKPVLILAPLAVSSQTVEEAGKFGIAARRVRTAADVRADIAVTNYERLHHFDPSAFGGVVCDESSIIKNFDGVRREQITSFMRKIKFRLLCTATAAPNDYIELGTSSEALGHLGSMDMLSTFFKNDEDSLHPAFIGSAWRLKRHAERDFWRWVASWARACRRPSDLGFDDREFILPALIETEHRIESPILPGELFHKVTTTLEELRQDTRDTVATRCEAAAEKLTKNGTAVAWCNLNAEADAIERMVPGAVQVSGSDDDDAKEEAFSAFRRGEIKVLVTKPRIASFGMNWQHCNEMTYFPTYSYEQYYQAVRRCWRFGQTRPVTVNAITTTAQHLVFDTMRRKAVACEEMFSKLVANMNEAIRMDRMKAFTNQERIPEWLSGSK